MSSQFLPLLAQVIERAFLTGVLVHRLGVDQFERWSLILATVSLLTMLDLGTQMTFSNRMAKASVGGDAGLAGRIYRESNLIFAGLALLVMAGTALFAFVPAVQSFLGFDAPLSASDRVVAMLMGATTAFRMAMSNTAGAYRATLSLARGTLIIAVADIVRASAAVAALLIAPGMVAPAAAMTIATVGLYGYLIPRDIAGRSPFFSHGLALPTPVTTHRAFRDSLLFAVNFLPAVVLTQIPVLIIGSRAATGVLAGYLLMRAVAGLIRTIVQRFAGVIGMEMGRLEAQGRNEQLVELYRHSGNVAAYLFGFAAAFAIVWGDVVLRYWSGSASLYDPLLLGLMLLPLVLAPRVQIAMPFVSYANRPAPLALAVTLQTTLAGALAWFLPVESIALRFTIAIYGAELLCLAPILLTTVGRALGISVVVPALVDIVRAGTVGLVTWLIAWTLRAQWDGITGLLIGASVLTIVVVSILLLAVRPAWRRAKLSNA